MLFAAWLLPLLSGVGSPLPPAAVASVGAVAPEPQGRAITLEEALRLARRSHPRLAAARADLSASDAGRKSARARMLPALAVGNRLNWSDSRVRLVSPLAGQGATEARDSAPSPLAAIPQEVGVNLFTVGVRQPLVDLLPLGYDYQSARADMAAEAERLAYAGTTLENDIRRRFASLFRARALVETAEDSERSLAEQVQRADAQMKAGAATRTDLLRIQAALAAARQQHVMARAAVTVAESGLLECLGLADEAESVVFVAPDHYVDAVPPSPPSLLRQTALSHRADLSAAIHTAEGLRLAARARLFDLLPKVALEASYVNLFGRGTAREGTHLHANAFVAGVTASWPLWTWGGQFERHQQARYRAQAARSRLELARRDIGTEVAARQADFVATDSGIALAEAQVAAAEEAYRVMVATLLADAATTTDLLAAEAAQTQARNALIEARFDAVLARLALQQALGNAPAGPATHVRVDPPTP